MTGQRVIAQNPLSRIRIANRGIATPLGPWGAGGAGGVVSIGAIQYSATPINTPGFKRADLCTEADIAFLRKAGVLSATPSFSLNKGYGTPAAALSWDGSSTNIDASTNTAPCIAFGDYWVLEGTNTGNLNAGHLGFGSGVRMGPTFSPTFSAPSGISFTNGEFNVVTSSGVYVFSAWNKSPASSAPIAVTQYGSTPPSGSTNYKKLYYYRGVWVAYYHETNAGATIPRYSTDRVTWTACTMVAPNTDSAGNGGSFTGLMEHPLTGLLVGVTGYGEIYTTPDGINWTRTLTKTAAGPRIGILQPSITPSGKLFAGGKETALGLNQVWYAPDVNTAFSAVTVSGATITAPGVRSEATAYYMGGVWVAFWVQAGGTLLAVSWDEGATWVQAIGSSGAEGNMNGWGSSGPLVLLTGAGFMWCVSAGSSPSNFVRLDFDFGRLTAPWVDMISGVVQRAYVKVQ